MPRRHARKQFACFGAQQVVQNEVADELAVYGDGNDNGARRREAMPNPGLADVTPYEIRPSYNDASAIYLREQAFSRCFLDMGWRRQDEVSRVC